MSFFQRAIRLWFVLLLVSITVDVACYWLAQHAPVPLPGKAGINYIAIFLVSAPAPFLLAVAIALLGGAFSVLRGVWLGFRRMLHLARRTRDYAAGRSMGLAPGHKG
ncbi:MAG: hypothetical protein ACREFL_10530 [Stellaceae bacterium]